MLENHSDVVVKLENDVAGHGKFRVSTSGHEINLLWKWAQGKF